MDTSELIKALAADKRRPAAPLAHTWWSAAGLALALAAAIVFTTLRSRPDIAIAAETPRFLFKLVFAIALAATSFGLVRALSRPGEDWRRAIPLLAIPPALLALAVTIEVLLVPPDTWSARMIGANSLACLTAIVLIGLGPLAIILAALQRGAPTRPVLAGAVAGLLAGGITAAFYAAHCTDDSPLFVATWYTLAITALAILGAAATHRFVRW